MISSCLPVIKVANPPTYVTPVVANNWQRGEDLELWYKPVNYLTTTSTIKRPDNTSSMAPGPCSSRRTGMSQTSARANAHATYLGDRDGAVAKVRPYVRACTVKLTRAHYTTASQQSPRLGGLVV